MLFGSCGAVLVPESVSATLTVQVAGLLAGVESGQSSVVEVERAVTVIVSLPLLAAWMEVGVGLALAVDRKSVGEGKRVDLGGRRLIKKKKGRSREGGSLSEETAGAGGGREGA